MKLTIEILPESVGAQTSIVEFDCCILQRLVLLMGEMVLFRKVHLDHMVGGKYTDVD